MEKILLLQIAICCNYNASTKMNSHIFPVSISSGKICAGLHSN